MNRVLFETNYMNPSGFKYIVIAFCIILFLYLCLKVIVRVDKKMQIKGKKIGILKIMEKIVLFIIIIGIVTEIEEYFDIVVRYKTGHYIEVEGAVENYSFVPGRMGTSFTIDGVDFYCPSSSWGYEPTNESNKVIKENGQYLKIRYITDEIQGNVIVYIEQLIPGTDN